MSVEGDSVITGFMRDLHAKEASGSGHLLLPNRGFIFKRDTKMLKNLGEETSVW